MDVASNLVTGLITLIAALGGGYLGHRFQSDRDRTENDRRRQDAADDAERATLFNIISACGELDKALTSIAVRSSRFERHSQLQGVVIPMEDLLVYEEARSSFVTAYTILKSDELGKNAASAVQASYDALFSLVTNDLNDLSEPFLTAKYHIAAVAAWARLMYYGRSELIDWNKPPVNLTPMSNHPLEAMLREGKLRAQRPEPHLHTTESDTSGG